MPTKTPTPLAPWIKVDPSLVFDPETYAGCRKRVRPAQMLVGHWTGGPDFTAAQIVHILRTRVDAETKKPEPLSVCFAMETDGTVYQLADLAKTTTYHARKVNDFSHGIEISSPGFPPSRKVARRELTLEVHGQQVKQVAYTDAQLASWVRLADLCAAELGFPKQVPGIAGKLFNGVMTPVQAKGWHGFGEHLHFSRKKSDGGTQLSRALMEAGYALGSF